MIKKMISKKGIATIMFIMLFGVAIITMVFLFLIFFKVHITFFAVDQFNINSYSTFLSSINSLDIPEENSQLTFVVNKFENLAGYQWIGNLFINSVEDALPESCYKFEIHTEKSKIIFEKKEPFQGTKDLPGFGCDDKKIRLRSLMSMPVIKNGQSSLINSELVIYATKEFKLPQAKDFISIIPITTSWPLVSRK